MHSKTLLTSSLAALLLAACASAPPAPPAKTVTRVEYVYPDCGTPPARAPIDFRPISWQVLEVLGEQRFTLTAGEYEDLAFNMSELTLGVNELKAERDYYKTCLAEFNPKDWEVE